MRKLDVKKLRRSTKSYKMLTHNGYLIFAILLIAFLLFSNLPADAETASCTCPELMGLLEESRDLLGLTGDTLPMARGICLQPPQQKTDIQWFGVALEDPVGGALFALDCSGKVVGVTGIGAIIKLTEYPPLDDFSKVTKVDYIARVAEGYGLQKVAIFAFQSKKIHELWSHDSFEADFRLPTKDGMEITYSFQFSPDGKTISMAGKRKTYPVTGEGFLPENVTIQNLKPRRFCWDNKGAFKECGDR
jgi:hypothetical protein